MSKTMRAIGQRTFGGPEVLEELTLPVPDVAGADLLLRVHAVAINPVDVKVRTNWGGFGELQGGVPVITGWDVAGVVEAVGPQADGRFKKGDEVWCAGSVARTGSHREFTLVDSRLVGRKPRSISFAEAAAMPLTGLTVWEGMFDHAGISLDAGRPQETVLVVGGAGGVGSIAIQMLKKLAGLRVIATASRPASAAHCKTMGADLVIDHSKDIAAQLKATGIAEVNHVLHTSEPEDNIEAIAQVVAPLGRIVCILPISKPINLGPLFARSITVVHELMFTRSLFGRDLPRQGQILDRMADLVDAGTLKSTLVDQLPWTADGVRASHARIEGRRGLGKAVHVCRAG